MSYDDGKLTHMFDAGHISNHPGPTTAVHIARENTEAERLKHHQPSRQSLPEPDDGDAASESQSLMNQDPGDTTVSTGDSHPSASNEAAWLSQGYRGAGEMVFDPGHRPFQKPHSQPKLNGPQRWRCKTTRAFTESIRWIGRGCLCQGKDEEDSNDGGSTGAARVVRG